MRALALLVLIGCSSNEAKQTGCTPSSCAGGTICCATLQTTAGGSFCHFQTGPGECRTTCESQIPGSCPAKGTVRVCRSKSDCSELDFAKCCLFEADGVSSQFCANSFAAFAGKCD